MKITRRQFLKGALVAGAGFGLPFKFGIPRAYPFAQSPTNIRKFVTSLPGLTPAGANEIGQYIPLAKKRTKNFAGLSTDVYNIAVTKFSQKMHPDLPGKTHFFGYGDVFTLNHKYLGGAIVATRGTPVLLTVHNRLPAKHILPVDGTLMAGPDGLTVGDLPQNRIVTHLHGGLTPWFSDGTPFQWFTPLGMHGPSFMNVPGTSALRGTATYYYPNDQSARLVWYHDHAIGITRLNAYAGIASAYIITDAFEAFLLNQGLLPDLVGIPLIVQDKTFFDPASDPNYPVTGAKPGDLWYPWDYEKDTDPTGRWAYGPDETPPAVIPNPNLPPISAVPEFFADTAMVNGAPYPVLTVKEGTFRFRILNGSQARFWHLNLYYENPVGSGEVTSTLTSYGKPDLSTAIPGPIMYQVGTEGGFLPAVALHDNTTPIPLDLIGDPSGNTANPDGPFNLLLGPAERADILINFSGLNGNSFILYSDAPGPFPGGDPRTDYFTGDPDQTAIGGAPTTQSLKGPNTRTIMKIVVDNSKGITGGPFPDLAALNTALNQNFFGGNPVPPQQPTPLDPTGFTPLIKTLNEDFDDYGRLVQRGGTEESSTNNQGGTTFGKDYISEVTENPSAGETQIWDFYNNTGDTHPWHFHLVNVQIVGRGIFAYTTDSLGFPIPTFGSFTSLSGDPDELTPPDPNEMGWKETVRMNPGEVTRVIIKFDLPNLPTQAMRDAVSPRTGGHEYVHHCHILEHEEHDMMRPLVIS